MREPESDSNRSRIFSRSRNAYISGVPHAPMSCSKKSEQRGVILQPREFGEDDAQIFGALGNFDAGEFLDAERVGPVVRHRAKIIEPVGVRHRAEIARVLADFFVVAMQIAEDRFELDAPISPSSATFIRNTPCVDGCCGPIETSSNSPSSREVIAAAELASSSLKSGRTHSARWSTWQT